jgi:hypothetical protein
MQSRAWLRTGQSIGIAISTVTELAAWLSNAAAARGLMAFSVLVWDDRHSGFDESPPFVVEWGRQSCAQFLPDPVSD